MQKKLSNVDVAKQNAMAKIKFVMDEFKKGEEKDSIKLKMKDCNDEEFDLVYNVVASSFIYYEARLNYAVYALEGLD